MRPETFADITSVALFTIATAGNVWSQLRRRHEDRRAALQRGRAIELVEGMRKTALVMGKSVTAVSTEELKRIREALEA